MEAVTTSRVAAGSQEKIKLCGYLKKKRNKVGGWRKMWFVLQDKLLLSYSSKEEYENKLVSFKDVVNLVPGTLVRPLGGFRFTIETTSQTMYTFHCDDRVAYREWITMLLYSLAAQDGVPTAAPSSAVDTKAATVLVQRFRNVSLDNIPGSLGNGVRCATSCTSVSRLGATAGKPAAGVAACGAVGCVRLPIAQSTAKILERNGVNPTDINTANREPTKALTTCYACFQQHHQQQLEHNSMAKRIQKDNSNAGKDLKMFSLINNKSVRLSKSLGQEREVNSSVQAPKLMEPVYAVVDLRNKYAQRKLRNPNLETKRSISYESIVQNVCYSEIKPKEKVASRTPLQDNNIEAIYEENNESLPQQNIKYEENIYEPINISSVHKNTSILAYFNRLKISSLQQLNRFRNKSNMECKCAKQTAQMSDHLNKSNSTRKSIKVRMRKFCFKEYEPKPFFKHIQPSAAASAATSTTKKPKNRWKSVKLGAKSQNVLNEATTKTNQNKRFFGSLPHLKRARISLFSNQNFQSS